MQWHDGTTVVSLALISEQAIHQRHGKDLLHHGDQRSGWSLLFLPGLCARLRAVGLILRALPAGTLHREGDQPVQGVSSQHLPVHPPGLWQGGLHPMWAWQQEQQGTEAVIVSEWGVGWNISTQRGSLTAFLQVCALLAWDCDCNQVHSSRYAPSLI